jgi:hypothetical protein
MVVIRHEAGDEAPADGMYALVGHFGEASGVAVWRCKGERLPLVIVSDDLETPLWFVRVADEAVERLVA